MGAGQEPRAGSTRTFRQPWGSVEFYADGPVPEPLARLAPVAAELGPRFRPALARFDRGQVAGYLAVWAEVPAAGEGPFSVEDLAGVVLAEVDAHLCFACGARFRVVHVDGGMPFFGANARAHQVVSGCPACGGDFARTRVQGLVVTPEPRPTTG